MSLGQGTRNPSSGGPVVPEKSMTRRVHGVCPLDCPDTCSWVVTVQDGRAVKLQGNREHPYTRGALCVSSIPAALASRPR